MPAVNWGLFAAVVALVVGFGSSAKLATAYGIAVTGTLLVDSVLFLFVVRLLWRKPLWMVVAGILGLRDRRSAVPGRQRHEDPPRRLVPAPRRREWSWWS